MRNTVIKVLMIGFMGLFIVGCSTEKLDAFIRTDVDLAMASRIAANKSVAKQLYDAGLMSEEELKDINKQLDDANSAYTGENLASNSKMQKKLFNGIVDWNAPDYKSSSGLTEEDWKDAVITSYIRDNVKGAESKIPLMGGTGSIITPITLIEPKTGEELNKRFGYTVHVLKPMAELEGTKNVDDLMARVQSAVKKDGKVDEKILGQLFERAKDENGNDVTLLDTTKDEYKIVKESKGSNAVGLDNKVKGDYTLSKQGELGNKEARPGLDMVIKSSTTQDSLITMRFIEFDTEAVNNVIKTLGMNPDQYVFSGNNVYIMEYPVYYVSEIKDNKDDANRFESVFSKSSLALNMQTGKMMKKGSAWGNEGDTGVYMDDTDPYLSVNGATSNEEESQSAFVIMGEVPEDDQIKVGAGKVAIRTGMVVLRDYLETTYAPNVVEGENLVVLGRKIRVKTFAGSKDEVFAEFYDKSGKPLEDSSKLYVNDIADFESLNSKSPTIQSIGRVGEEKKTTKASIDNSSENEKRDLNKIEELDITIQASIKPTIAFPSKSLGRVDYSMSNKPLFYGMAVKTNMFETGLFSGWINAQNSQENSLDWWRKWLVNPNRAYMYKINWGGLEGFLESNYVAELQESGVMVLDLEVIAKIQQDYTQENVKATVRQFRTIFIIIGWLLVVYGAVLLMAWMLDTNVDLGFNILEKLSFRQMIATKDPEIMNETYVGFGGIVRKSMVIATLGIILISVNITTIVAYMVSMFGGLAEMIADLI